MMSTTERCFD